MMTEQRLQEIERRSTQGWRADWTETLEAVAEIRRLRAEVEQAQQELTAERAEQEAVTAERNEAVQGLRDCHMLARRALAAATRDGTAKHLPHILRICERQAPEGTQFTSFLRDEAAAQPPVLPPLPDKWQRQEYDSESVTFLNGPDFYFDAFASGVVMHIDDCFTARINVADLLIVLRHAEAAHLQLKEGK